MRPGDVLAVRTDDQQWHLCYLGRHETLGDTLWVSLCSHALDATWTCRDLSGDGYYVFYPATAAVRRNMAVRAGYCPEAMRKMPRLLRYSSPFVRDGDPQIWRIAESARVDAPFVVCESLTVDEAELPEAAIWNHEYLLDRLRSGWHPRQEASGHSPDAV